MKNSIQALIFFIIFIIYSLNSNAQVYDIVIGDDLKKDAQEVIEQMINGMNNLVNNAIDRGDFITESRLKEAGLMLDGLKNFIHNERIETLETIDIQRLNILKGLDQMMAGNLPSIYEINDLAAILTANTQDIANSLGGLINTKDKFGIYRINGISLEHKKTGLYKISFIGNVFGKTDIQNKIIINGYEKILHQSANTNNMYVEFPSSEIEHEFNDTTVSRIPIEIISIRNKRRLFSTKKDTIVSFKNTVLLHPKFPIQYELMEISKKYSWSEAIVGQLKEMYTVPNENTTITTNVPDGYKIDQEKTRFYDPINAITRVQEGKCSYRQAMRSISSLVSIPESQITEKCREEKNSKLNTIGNWIEKPVYFNEGNYVRRTYKASSRKKIWVEIYYNKPIQDTPIEIPRKLKNENSGFLSYGVYESDFFSNDYVSYRLKVKFFYDDWQIINPTSATTIKGIRTDMELGGIKRLTINISSLTAF